MMMSVFKLRSFNARSIYVRLITGYTILAIGASVAVGLYTYDSLRGHLYAETRATLTRRAEHIRTDIMPMIAAQGVREMTAQIEQVYSPEASNEFISIVKKGGDAVYISGLPQDRGFDPRDVPAVSFAADIDQSNSCSREVAVGHDGVRLLVVGCGVDVGGVAYTIEMGAPIAGIDRVLRKFVLTLLIEFPAVAAIAVIGGLFLMRRALQPVEAIRASAEQITFGNLRTRLPVAATGDAIEHLSRTLNQMLDRLDQAYQQASRFSADASHELRTPLAVMRGEIEAVMRGGGLPAAAGERLGSVLEEIERLSGIAQGLSAIARLDAGEAMTSLNQIDLAALTRATLEQMQLLAAEKEQTVDVDAPHPVFVRGDAARLKQVVVNLLDNAIKYTGTGGHIRLSVYADAARAMLRIHDDGVGIAPESLPFIFDRFYRADKTRSRATHGAGLGLSIVQAICMAHGGSIRAESEEGAGSVLTVELPLAAAGSHKDTV